MNSVLNPLSEKSIQGIQEEELRQHCCRFDENTVLTQFTLTEEMRNEMCSDVEFWKDEAAEYPICDVVTCEYQLDTGNVYYTLPFEDEHISVSTVLSCEALDDKIRRLSQC